MKHRLITSAITVSMDFVIAQRRKGVCFRAKAFVFAQRRLFSRKGAKAQSFLILFLGGLAAWREANKNTGNYMRGKLRVGETIVREIRPMDVIRTCDRLLFDFKDGDSITDDQWSKALFADSDLIEGELNDDVNSAFSFINHDYLKNDVPTLADSPKKGLSMRRLKTLRAMLMKECAVLATYNHVNCWLYGWSFFSAVRALYQDK